MSDRDADQQRDRLRRASHGGRRAICAQHGVEVDRRLQRLRQIGRGLQPLPATLAEANARALLDHVAGGAGERLDELLVLPR